MFGTESGDSRRIVGELAEYMKEKGLTFKSINLEDSSPYAILTGKSSVGFRKSSKWNKTGIVFFCTETDARRIHSELQLTLDDNSTDASRPYAIFVRDGLVADVVRVLKMNPANVLPGAGLTRTTISPVTRKGKDSYQNKFWDDYFPHVKSCLARDDYSSSDSNTETTVRDTFYLERKDPRDFLSWFESKETVEEAKKRIVEYP